MSRKPDDTNGRLPTAERPFRVLLIAGSDRRQYNCPGVDSQGAHADAAHGRAAADPTGRSTSRTSATCTAARGSRAATPACRTSMALCVWPCNCYEKGDNKEPDLMWDLDLYARLDLADAWAIIGPHQLVRADSNLKLMFDRLVCMNGGNPREDAIDHKDPEKAMALEHTAEWQALEREPPRGAHGRLLLLRRRRRRRDRGRRTAGKLRHKHWFDPEDEPFANCATPTRRWSGSAATAASRSRTRSGRTARRAGTSSTATTRPRTWCSEAGVHGAPSTHGRRASPRTWRAKGKVEPGEYRAYGHEAPGHRWADAS